MIRGLEILVLDGQGRHTLEGDQIYPSNFTHGKHKFREEKMCPLSTNQQDPGLDPMQASASTPSCFLQMHGSEDEPPRM
jgi:hypothetical protein